MSPTAPPTTPPPQRSSTKWIFIGCGGCLVLAIIAAVALWLGGVGIFKKVTGMIKESRGYQEAFSMVANSPAVQAEIGTPIELVAFPTGSINTENDLTTATLIFSVKGPNGTAAVTANATYTSSGPVNFSELTVATSTGKQFNLAGPASLPEGTTPPQPPQPPPNQ
jgi:hypothetical protein